METKINPVFTDRTKCIHAVVHAMALTFDGGDIKAVKSARDVMKKLQPTYVNFGSSTWRAAELHRRQDEISAQAIADPDSVLTSKPRNPLKEIQEEALHFYDMHSQISKDLAKKLAGAGKRVLGAWIAAAQKLLADQVTYEKSIAAKFHVGHADSNFVKCLQRLIEDMGKNLDYVEKKDVADVGLFDGFV